MTAPSSLRGFIDDGALTVDGYGEVVDLLLENVPALRHPESVRTFAAMRHDPQLAAILRVYLLALERGTWVVNGDGCRDETVQNIADNLGLPIKGVETKSTGARRRKFTWSKHLPVAARLSMTFGHAPFAQQWDEAGGLWRLGMVQERMPQTIGTLKFNQDGTLAAASQGAVAVGGRGLIDIRTANHELIWYAREREGTNYFGQSLIREAYAPWLIKTELLRVHATSIRRFGMGVWTVTAPNGTVGELAEAERLAATYQAGRNAGAGLPPGFVAKLTGMTGNVPDAMAFINYLDRQMTRATLTSILDMATAEKGNRSLGDTVMQLMTYAQQAEANRIAEDATDQIVIPLVDANFGEDEPCPTIEVSDVGVKTELSADEMANLLHYGGLRPDEPYRAWLRRKASMPVEDPNYVPPAKPANPAPEAP